MALTDRSILRAFASATKEQGRRYLLRANLRAVAEKKARGIVVKPLALAEADEIVGWYWTIGEKEGIDPVAALGQAIHETAAFTFGNQVAAAQHNPAGLGATNDGAAGGGWLTWRGGIDAHYVHLLAWCNDRRGDVDYRIAAVRGEAKKKGWATTWASLGGRWAVPGLLYGEGVERHWAGIIAEKEGSMILTKPQMTDAPSPNHGYAGDYKPEIITWHITAGSGASAFSWLRNPESNASSNYLNMETGEIKQLVNPENGQQGAAWANGDVQNPNMANPSIASYVRAGVNPNRRCVSIENAGQSSYGKGGSLTGPQVASLVNLTAWLCKRFGIPPDREHIVPHAWINDVTRHNCPGFSEHEYETWIGRIAALVRGTSQEVQVREPKADEVVAYLNDKGETIVAANFGGNSTRIDGYIIKDMGISTVGDDHGLYDRSIQGANFQPWHKRDAS